MLRKDPTRKILYCSYAFGFARKQTAKAKALARKAGVALSRGRRTDYWETKAGGFVMAAGIGGQLAGEGTQLALPRSVAGARLPLPPAAFRSDADHRGQD